METQPFVVVLLFLTLLLTGKSADVPLDALSITLLMLGLHWWAMLIKYLERWKLTVKLEGPLQFFGLLLGLAVTIVIHPLLLTNVSRLLVVIVLVFWFWERGKRRVRIEVDEERLIFSFKLCFIVLLAVLLVTLPVNPAIATPTLAAIALSLPLFFVSGLIALSFVRLSITRRENRRDQFAAQHRRSAAWPLFLALAWSMLTIIALLLETFAFSPLLALFTPIINAVENVAIFLWNFFSPNPVPVIHRRPKVIPTPTFTPRSTPITLHFSLSLPVIILIFVTSIVILVVSFLLLAWFLFSLRDMFFGRTAKKEGEQEALDVRSILRERRRNRQGKAHFRLEPLNPNSIRARYRDLLLATARRGGDIQRFPHETPAEYQQRLLAVIETLPNKEGEPSNATIVRDLTEAYTLERYGRTKPEPKQVGYFKKWIPYLVKRLKRIKM